MSEKLQNYIKPDLKNGVNSNQKSAYLVWIGCNYWHESRLGKIL